MRAIHFALLAALLLPSAAAAETNLTDADLLNFAQAFHGLHWPARPAGGVVGRHHGADVVVEERCSDICPNYLVYIIHYAVAPGPACDAIGGGNGSAIVPSGIAAVPATFCVPDVLLKDRMFFGHWRPGVRRL